MLAPPDKSTFSTLSRRNSGQPSTLKQVLNIEIQKVSQAPLASHELSLREVSDIRQNSDLRVLRTDEGDPAVEITPGDEAL